jgi:hypothetical protein
MNGTTTYKDAYTFVFVVGLAFILGYLAAITF